MKLSDKEMSWIVKTIKNTFLKKREPSHRQYIRCKQLINKTDERQIKVIKLLMDESTKINR